MTDVVLLEMYGWVMASKYKTIFLGNREKYFWFGNRKAICVALVKNQKDSLFKTWNLGIFKQTE